jgi:hypothetical protein
VGHGQLRRQRWVLLREFSGASQGVYKCVCVSQSVGYNGTVTREYEAAAQAMTRRQIALGGYRLAQLLDSLLQKGVSGHLRGSRPA